MEVSIVVEQLRHQVTGGIGTYVRGLVAGLTALDDNTLHVTALASRGGSPDPLDELGLSLRRSRLGHRMQMVAWDHGIGRVASGDVLHLTSLAGPAVTTPGPARTVMVHDLAWRTNPELTTARGRRWHEAALQRIVTSPASLLVPSETVATALERAGAAADRIHVVGEGADHLPPASPERATEILLTAGVTGSFLLTVSTLEPRKNLVRLAEAHAQARQRSSTIPDLVVVGPTGWGASPRAQDGVHFLGQVPGAALAALLEGCQGFVYVPMSEGFGLPPLEAMMHGAPVVASSTTPSMQEAPVVDVVVPEDTASIVEALETLCSGSSSVAEAGEAGRAFAARHRWVDVAANHVAIWSAVR